MRRLLAVAALCLLVASAGCADVGISIETPEPTDGAPTETPEGSPASTASPPSTQPPIGDGGSAANGTFTAHYINVGQADATLLVSPAGETMLIDSGDWRDDGETVLAYLESRGIDRIDHLVSTHAHADHVGGHEAVIDHYETEKDGIGAVYDSGAVSTSQTYEEYLDAVERHDVTLYEVAEGDEIPFAGPTATVLNPEESGGEDLHDNAVVLHVQFGETSFLFTGDAERNVEERLVADYGDGLGATVYKAGHHGSDTSSGPGFLDAVDPELAVVSSAYDSQYGHPHEEPLERFAERGVRTTWTAVHGTTVVETDGNGTAVTVRTQHDATTDPLELRDAKAATAEPSNPADVRFTVGGTADRIGPIAPSGRTAAAVAATGG